MRLRSLYRKSLRNKNPRKVFLICFSIQCSQITLIIFAPHAWIATILRKKTIAMSAILVWANFNFILSFVLTLIIRAFGMLINFGCSMFCGGWLIEWLITKESLMYISKSNHNPTFGSIWQSFMILFIKWI